MSDKAVNIIVHPPYIKQVAITAGCEPKRVTIDVHPAPRQVSIAANRTPRQVSIQAHHCSQQVNIAVNKIAGPAGKNFDFTVFSPERLCGTVDGVNRIFHTTARFEASTLVVFVNGLKENHFSVISDSRICLDDPPKNTGFTDVIEAFYIKKTN